MKYLFSLIGKDGCVFDEGHFDNLDDGKEWAKGRGRFHNIYDDKFHKYKVMIHKYEGDVPVPVSEYYEEYTFLVKVELNNRQVTVDVVIQDNKNVLGIYESVKYTYQDDFMSFSYEINDDIVNAKFNQKWSEDK